MRTELDPAAPPNNLHAYSVLFAIENGIRELIIEELSGRFGPHWFKNHLPGDVLKKYRESVSVERKAKWTELISHHPIYYLDFPDLRKIMLQKTNWDDAFRQIFQNSNVLESMLSEIEVTRNRVAHNRKVCDSDVDNVEGVYKKLSRFVGDSRFQTLATRCTSLTSIRESLSELREKIDDVYQRCSAAQSCDSGALRSILDQWWFEELYLGNPLDDVVSFCSLVAEYEKLPRVRGEGHKIESWIKSAGLEESHTRAKTQLACIT